MIKFPSKELDQIILDPYYKYNRFSTQSVPKSVVFAWGRWGPYAISTTTLIFTSV